MTKSKTLLQFEQQQREERTTSATYDFFLYQEYQALCDQLCIRQKYSTQEGFAKHVRDYPYYMEGLHKKAESK